MEKGFLIVFFVVWTGSLISGMELALALETIRIEGSTTVLPIASKGAERFMRRYRNVRVTVNAGGSGVGLNSVAQGRADIGLMSRVISDLEKNRFKGKDFNITVVGHDAVAVVVSSEVYNHGVTTLTRQQIKEIYLGKLTNWNQVGGPNRPILVIDKERHRGTRHVFMYYIMGDSNAQAPGARLVTGSNNEEQAKIAQSDSAIGMLSKAWVNADVMAVAIKEGSSAVLPTKQNIRTKKFPIVRDLTMVTIGKPMGITMTFLNYILGTEMQTEIEKDGYVSVRGLGPR